MRIIANKSILHNNITNSTFIATELDEQVQTGTRENDSHIEWMGDLTIPVSNEVIDQDVKEFIEYCTNGISLPLKASFESVIKDTIGWMRTKYAINTADTKTDELNPLKNERVEALTEVDIAYYDPKGNHYRDNKRFHWAVKSINETFDELEANLTSNNNELPKITPLTQMTPEHFEDIFGQVGYAPNHIEEIIFSFKSLFGFHETNAHYGNFDSYRKAVQLGYDVEFTFDRK